MFSRIILIAALAGLAFLSAGSLLNLSSSAHWFVRGWDFPRVQIVAVAYLLFGVVLIVQYFSQTWSRWISGVALGMTLFLSVWHGYRIYPYTVLAATQAKATETALLPVDASDPNVVRIVFSNVKMENQEFERWTRAIQDAAPDLVVALEVNQDWMRGMAPLFETFQHRVEVPQDNWYGMTLLSSLPIESQEVRYLVQEDIPSIDTIIRLENGEAFRFVAVHPRPPVPIRDTSATARDAELILWGRELDDERRPVVIGGDLNDVAWSRTTRLFLRTSQLLDPRRGRGMYNSFDATRPYLRFPLDHVFFSTHFTLNRLERLPDVGSDHFPILVELRLAPSASQRHDPLQQQAGDKRKANRRIERAEESENTQGSAVDDQGEEIEQEDPI